MSSSKKVLFILTGSIACYKACHVISRLVQAGIQVQVVATNAALQFVGAATLEGLSGRPVLNELYENGKMMAHIHLVRDADLILVAPATANFINKMRMGLADDLASALFLAHDFKKPFLISPAMNLSMYRHPVTQFSISELSKMGLEFILPSAGALACGETGDGRLQEPDEILRIVFGKLNSSSVHIAQSKPATTQSKAGRTKVLVTAGGTQEALDQVRSLSNLSTGTTGMRIAMDLIMNQVDVTLLLAEKSSHWSDLKELSALSVADRSLLGRLQVLSFSDFKSLEKILFSELSQIHYDGLVHAAAVSDYSIGDIQSSGKSVFGLSKIPTTDELILKLKRNPKLIDSVKSKSMNSKLKLVGFKLTSQAGESEVQNYVQNLFNVSKCDAVVHNDTRSMQLSGGKHLFNFYQKAKGPNALANGIEFEELSQSLIQFLNQQEAT